MSRQLSGRWRPLLLALASLVALLGGSALAAPVALSPAQARHLLIRTGFAPSEAEVQRIAGQSAQRAVQDIIAEAQSARPLHPAPGFTTAPPLPVGALQGSQPERQALRQQQLREGLEFKTWWLREMVETPAPLAERMAVFWHGHFATSQRKVVRSQAMWNQQQILRAHGLGSFRTLLHAVAKDPAMLVYLDGANSRKEAPNENFAREVMELFTLGEASQGGGYTEQDVKEAARAFTGWSVDRSDFSFRFRPFFHDREVKTVLGRSGNFDGDAVLDVLLEQPAAARFIVGKLWREFVSPQPDPREVERIAALYRQSGWNTSAVLRELFLSDAFWDPGQRGSLVKSPVELVVGLVRQFNFRYADTMPFAVKAAQLGQNLLAPPNVKGWPGYTEWINATTLLERKRFAMQMLRDGESASDAMNGSSSAGIGFDAEKWLSAYGGHADREPSPQTRALVAQSLLATAPTQAVPEGTVGLGLLRALALDPAYQLK